MVEVIGQSLCVTWSTNISDILTSAVTATNTNSGRNTCVIVGHNEREALIDDIETAAPYDVFVEIYDSCGRYFSSEPFHVNAVLSSTSLLKPSSLSSPDIEETHNILSPTPERLANSSDVCTPSQQSDHGNFDAHV